MARGKQEQKEGGLELENWKEEVIKNTKEKIINMSE